MVESIFYGVAANFITSLFWSMLILIGLLLVYYRERKTLLRFFGVTNELPKVYIYMSCLTLGDSAAKGFEQTKKGYTGSAIVPTENKAAIDLVNILRTRYYAVLPSGLRNWISSQQLTFLSLNPQVEVSPHSPDLCEPNANLILIGSGVYNVVSKHYLEENPGCLSFVTKLDKTRAVSVKKESFVGELRGRPDAELGVIIRRERGTTKGTVIICAGWGTASTQGTVGYLLSHWEELQRYYGDAPFEVGLSFPGLQPHSEAWDPEKPGIPIYPPEYIARKPASGGRPIAKR